MKPLFIVRDGERLIAAKRTTVAQKPVIQFLAKGAFPGDVSRVAFVLNYQDAYTLAQDLAKSCEQDPLSTAHVSLRLHDDFRGDLVDLDIRHSMAAELARHLLQKLGN